MFYNLRNVIYKQTCGLFCLTCLKKEKKTENSVLAIKCSQTDLGNWKWCLNNTFTSHNQSASTVFNCLLSLIKSLSVKIFTEEMCKKKMCNSTRKNIYFVFTSFRGLSIRGYCVIWLKVVFMITEETKRKIISTKSELNMCRYNHYLLHHNSFYSQSQCSGQFKQGSWETPTAHVHEGTIFKNIFRNWCKWTQVSLWYNNWNIFRDEN